MLKIEFRYFRGIRQVYASYDHRDNLIVMEIWTNYYTKIKQDLEKSSLFRHVVWKKKSPGMKSRSVLELRPRGAIRLVKNSRPKYIKSEESIAFFFKRQSD